MKPGYQTTEFWLALLSQVLALCVVVGWVSAADKERLETAFTNAIVGGITFAASAGVVWQYIRGRTRLKLQQANDDKPPRESAPAVLPFAVVLLAGWLLPALPIVN